ncbi:hypothetical protein [Limosilactobacillus reuteri]|uniref:hypothetical protein n=1 Tax=Limosilactobacillus reuteri TaxID=1598 RepID=UPI003CC58FC7
MESNHTRIQTAFLLVDHHQLQAHTALSKAKQLNLYRRQGSNLHPIVAYQLAHSDTHI